MRNRYTSNDVVFMATGQFEHLTDTECYVFSHIAFFACQQIPYNRTFKQTTKAICNKVAYSPNAVRNAIRSLIEKEFLKKVNKPVIPKEERFTYYDDIAHHLTIGNHEYAKRFAKSLQRALLETKSKHKGIGGRDITFFPVNVGRLHHEADIDAVSGNQSKHVHKTLILHAYLYHNHKWNLEKGRNKLSRSVSFLSGMLKWSQNTVRRLINSLNAFAALEYIYADNAVRITSMSALIRLKSMTGKLRTTLKKKITSAPSSDGVMLRREQSAANSRTQTPAEAAAFLKQYQQRT